MFRSVRLEQRVPQDHALRAIRGLTDAVLVSLSDALDALYPASGRRSIAPEYVLRVQLVQAFYPVRSERQRFFAEVIQAWASQKSFRRKEWLRR